MTFLVAAFAAATCAAPVGISGRWELHADFDDRSIPGAFARCTFTQTGRRFSGTCEDATVAGEINGDKVTWRVTTRNHDVVIFTGMQDDQDPVILGTFSYPGKGDGTFLAIKR